MYNNFRVKKFFESKNGSDSRTVNLHYTFRSLLVHLESLSGVFYQGTNRHYDSLRQGVIEK